jgi:hypothetical protein
MTYSHVMNRGGRSGPNRIGDLSYLRYADRSNTDTHMAMEVPVELVPAVQNVWRTAAHLASRGSTPNPRCSRRRRMNIESRRG